MTRREQLNVTRLGKLHHEFVPLAEVFLTRITTAGAHPLVTSTRRTFTEQDALYAVGRTVAGAPCRHDGGFAVGKCALHPLGATVTRARGGQSFHNYGLALDWVDEAASGELDAYEPADYDKTAYAKWIGFRPAGVRAGLLWMSPDPPHLEWSPGFGPSQADVLATFADAEGYLPQFFFRNRGAVA